MVDIKQLKVAEASLGERQGWDFSVMKTERDPIPWNYVDLVKSYLSPTDRVLDIGTGGGEVFLKIADSFGKGVGIDSDPEMVSTAKSRGKSELLGKVSFEVMNADDLSFPDNSFDMVVDRQGPIPVREIVRVLKSGGYFISQIVGGKNMQNINLAFDPKFAPESKLEGDAQLLSEEFAKSGCRIIAVCSYNVDYYVKDIASMLFWLRAIRSRGHATSAIPEDFSVDKYHQQIIDLLNKIDTPKGYKTNEHRELLIVRKN